MDSLSDEDLKADEDQVFAKGDDWSILMPPPKFELPQPHRDN
jgi:hypothetical protein